MSIFSFLKGGIDKGVEEFRATPGAALIAVARRRAYARPRT